MSGVVVRGGSAVVVVPVEEAVVTTKGPHTVLVETPEPTLGITTQTAVVVTLDPGTVVVDSEIGPPGPMGPPGPPGAANAVYSAPYRWSGSTNVPPADGQVRTNSGHWADATILRLADETDEPRDIGILIGKFKVGDTLYLQLATDGSRWAEYLIDAVPTDLGSYHEIPVTYQDGGGLLPNNNAGLIVILKTSGATASHWYTGTGPPAADLGRPGDLYLQDDGTVWENPANVDGWVATTTDLTGPQGIPGPPGAQANTFVHNQLTPSDTWTIAHFLGVWPSVTVVDSGGNVVAGDVAYLDANTLVVTFAVPFGGVAYLN